MVKKFRQNWNRFFLPSTLNVVITPEMANKAAFDDNRYCPLALVFEDMFGEKRDISASIQYVTVGNIAYILDNQFDYTIYSHVKEGLMTFKTTARKCV